MSHSVLPCSHPIGSAADTLQTRRSGRRHPHAGKAPPKPLTEEWKKKPPKVKSSPSDSDQSFYCARRARLFHLVNIMQGFKRQQQEFFHINNADDTGALKTTGQGQVIHFKAIPLPRLKAFFIIIPEDRSREKLLNLLKPKILSLTKRREEFGILSVNYYLISLINHFLCNATLSLQEAIYTVPNPQHYPLPG